MAKQVIQSPDAPAAIGPYSQAILAGNTLYMSGQIPLDPATGQARRRHRRPGASGVPEPARRRRRRRRDAERHRQAVDPADRPRRLREGQRDHGDVFRAALSGARDVSGGGLAARRAHRGRSDAYSVDIAVRSGRANGCPTSQDGSAQEAGGAKPAPAGDALAEKLARIGMLREQDLVLHLPLRYEDHTQLVPLAAVRSGEPCRPKASSCSAEIQYRPRRQLVCLLRDPDRGEAHARAAFFSFYPSQQKALDPARACACSATSATGTSVWRSCIRSSASSPPTRRCPIG